MAQKITPNLWFDGNAKEAVDYYVSIFPGSAITQTSYYPASAEEGLADFQADLAGKVLTIAFTLAGHDFVAINAGSEFTPTPAVSFLVNFDPSKDEQAREHIDEVWDKLRNEGEAIIEIGEHPFSKRYGWIKDRYGFTWQLMLTDPAGEERPCIIPDLLFSGPVQNQAGEAMSFYQSVFSDSKPGALHTYPSDQGPAKAGAVMFADFVLAGQWFAAMDSAVAHDYTFNEAVSFSVACKDQAEIDELWSKLSSVPEAEQCGWCKDKYGVSWQIVPANMDELMSKPGAFAKMMQMHKITMAEF